MSLSTFFENFTAYEIMKFKEIIVAIFSVGILISIMYMLYLIYKDRSPLIKSLIYLFVYFGLYFILKFTFFNIFFKEEITYFTIDSTNLKGNFNFFVAFMIINYLFIKYMKYENFNILVKKGIFPTIIFTCCCLFSNIFILIY